MEKRLALFDIDGTVFRSSLLVELLKQLIAKQIFPKEAEDHYRSEYKSWLNREGTYDDFINAVIISFLKYIKGVEYGMFADIGKDVVAKHKKRVYRYTRNLINQLRDEGYFLVAISQSPKTILDEFCKEYGFEKVYGRIYEIGPQDRFTGAVVDEHLISNKATIVRRVSENQNISLSNSIGVGDTESDIPLLDSVEKQICFNPNKALYTHALRMGWKIVIERKDVIYEL